MTASIWPQPAARVYVGGTFSSADGQTKAGAQDYRALTYSAAGATTVRPIEVDITFSMEWGSVEPAQCRVMLAEYGDPYVTFPYPLARVPLVVDIGYVDPVTSLPVYERGFTGWLVSLDKTWFPYTDTLVATGMLSLAQLPLRNQRTFRNRAEWSCRKRLYEAAGIRGWDIDGLDTALGTIRPIIIQEYSQPADMLGQLNKLTQYLDHDQPNGEVKTRRLEVDEDNLGTSPEYAFSESPGAGELLIMDGATSHFDGTATRNRQKVLGLIPDDPRLERPEHSRRMLSEYIPSDPGYVSETISSDLIQTDDLAEDVCRRAMKLRNCPAQTFNLSTPGNPYIEVGKLATLYSPSRGIGRATIYQVYRVAHRIRAGSFETEVALRRHFGDDGGREDIRPVADFGFELTDNGDGTTTVDCTWASESTDPDGDDELQAQFSNNRTADTFGGAEADADTYSFALDTPALDGCEVTLTVTDPDRMRDSITRRVDL